ncbi:MAG: membrane dipeptidase [Terriglobia bacterium]|nr:MAG: membrane dipeptidase [Terriglobia bacterium]
MNSTSTCARKTIETSSTCTAANDKHLKAIALVFLAATLLPAQTPGRKKRTVTDAEVQRVHSSAILIDTHNDVTSQTVTGLDIGGQNPGHHTDLPRMKRGGMGAQFFAVYVAASYVEGNHAAHRTLEMIDTVRHDIAGKYPADFMLALTAEDIRRAHQQHKIAALLGIEGGHAIEDSLRLLRRYYDEGVRYMTLTHSNSNHWADSSGDPAQPNNGLSAFGKDVVREMNRLGMIVDISHVSDKTFWDALETSGAPIFASHSSCRALSPAPRNMTDEMIQALARKGGVVQVNFSCDFLNPEVLKAGNEVAARRRALRDQLAQKYANQPDGLTRATNEAQEAIPPPRERATLRDVVKHINHIVEIAGVDAVGLGSDFDGVSCVPEGLESVEQWPNLTRALLEEGYTASDIRKIYGENSLRLMTAVERAAGR